MSEAPVPVVARVYDRLVASCTTINQVNRVNIALERSLTPSEIMILAQHLRLDEGMKFGFGFVANVRARRALEENLRRRLGTLRQKYRNVAFLQRRRNLGALQDRLSSSLTPLERRRHSALWALTQERQLAWETSGKDSPAVSPKSGPQFLRVWRRPGAALFSSRDSAVSEVRSLIVCFTGTTRRMGMPVSLWLNNVSCAKHDVLVLQCPPAEFFMNGARGFSDSLPATRQAVTDLVLRNSYADVSIVASSGGTMPALFTGLWLGVKGILLAGPVAPNVELWRQFLHDGELFSRIAEAARAAPAVGIPTWVSYGVDDKADVLFAEKLAPVVPGARLIPVPNAGHNCFYELARRGELAKLVSDFLAPTPVVF